MKKVALAAVAVAIIALIAFLYAVRPMDEVTVAVGEVREEQRKDEKQHVISEGSYVRYTIDEKLDGRDKRVVGETDNVTGTVAITGENTINVSFSDVQVNARTFTTDSRARDNAVARYILRSEEDANEFITFSTEEVITFTAEEREQKISKKLEGFLTVSGITKPVVFDVALESYTGVEATFSVATVVEHVLFGLRVPDLPFLSDVSETVLLEGMLVTVRG